MADMTIVQIPDYFSEMGYQIGILTNDLPGMIMEGLISVQITATFQFFAQLFQPKSRKGILPKVSVFWGCFLNQGWFRKDRLIEAFDNDLGKGKKDFL